MDHTYVPVVANYAPDDTLRGHDVVYIAGAKGDDASGRTPIEGEDTLFSTAYAHVLDLVSEGEIGGLVDGLKSVYLDETPVQNADGTMNFKNVTVDFRPGTPTQDYMPGFPSIQSEVGVGVELKQVTPWSQALNDLELSAVSVRISTNALAKTDPDTGDIGGYAIDYAIDIAKDGGAFSTVYNGRISGKTTAKYERTHRIDLPKATISGWIVRVRRITADTTDVNIQDTTTIESYTAIIDAKMRYPYSALVGVKVDSSQFRSVPRRAYNLLGVIVQVPTNYDPIARTYTGTWDGTFKMAWTNNPAWLYYAMATNERFGLGSTITASQVDKWALYSIAQYCDGLVPTGDGARATIDYGPVQMSITAAGVITTTGNFTTAGFKPGDAVTLYGWGSGNDGDALVVSVSGTTMTIKRPLLFTAQASASRNIKLRTPMEPRFTATIYLQKRGDAFKVMQDLASAFRGISYWGNGAITAVADKPEDPVYTYTNSNVVDGKFTYQGSGRRARHTVALVSWNDPSDFGRGKVEYVQDEDGVARYGIQELSVTGFACTSQSQAQRIGRHILLSELLETDTVGFNVGLDGTLVAPGKLIRVADENRMGKRVGGRISASTTTTITVDKLPTPTPVAGDTVIASLPTGLVEKRTILSVDAVTRVITMTAAFSALPVPESVWAIESTTLVAPIYRIIGVAEGEGLTFNVSALKHEPQKFDAVELGTRIQVKPTSVLPKRVLGQVTGLTLAFHERAGQVFVSPFVSATWNKLATAAKYMYQWRRENGEWTTPRVATSTHAQYDHAFAGDYEFKVWGVNASGIPSLETTASLTVNDQNMAPNLMSDLADQAATAAADAAAALTQANLANADLANIASDNVLSVGEKKRVIADRDVIVAEQAGLDANATTFGITTEKTNYDTAVTALTTYLATLTTPYLWSDQTAGHNTTIVGTTFRAKFADVYAKRQVLLNKIATVTKTLADNAQTAANTAITNAATAQAAATAAQSDINNMSSDSLLTPVEKKRVLADWNAIFAEKARIDAQAADYNVDAELTTYDAAYTALQSYLAGLTTPTLWSNFSGNTTIVGATFRQKFGDYYNARQVLLQKIADLALYGPDYQPGENLLPNPQFTSNRVGAAAGAYIATNKPVCDGWLCGGYTSTNTQNSQAGVVYATGSINLKIYGQTAIAAGDYTPVSAQTGGRIYVQPGKTYEFGFTTAGNTWNGSFPTNVNDKVHMTVRWYNSAGTALSYVGTAERDRTSGTAYATAVAPAGAAYCYVQCRAFIQNLTASSWTHNNSVALNVYFTNVFMRKLDDLCVADSGYQLGGLTNQIITGVGSVGSRWSGGAITFSIPTTGSPAVVTINVAAGTLQCGSKAVAYSASSGTVNQTRSTTVTYWLYYVDGAYAGGTKTLNITTNGQNIVNADDRVWVGSVEVTTPAVGTGGSGGGFNGGGCVDVDMWVDGDRQVGFLQIGDVIDCAVYSEPPGIIGMTVQRNPITVQPCFRLVSETGAAVVASEDTPMQLPDGSALFTGQMLGQMLLVDDGRELRWERCVEVTPVGFRPVMRINVSDTCYFAGNKKGGPRIATHNTLTGMKN